MVKIYLASNSPRRAQLLKQIGCNFELLNPDVEEFNLSGICPRELSARNAALKARAAAKLLYCQQSDGIVLAADTVVALDDEIFGKPENAEDAERMLSRLSGNKHSVYTAVHIVRGVSEWSTVCVTEVLFGTMSEADIKRYIATGEPMDKAGAYGIQGYGALFVESISGCYFNVMGLPLAAVRKLIKQAGVELF